jgi:hypothetical protein
VGRELVEVEQQGKARADYGERLIANLAKRLSEHFGRGMGVATLRRIRRFYLTYPTGTAMPSDVSGLEIRSTPLIESRAPEKRSAAEVLEDLVTETPGEEGKWFAAAKNAKLFDEAIALANRTPCSPQTLTRAARDFEEKRPEFAIEAGMAALHWLVEGYGYEITGLDVVNAYSHTMKAAENAGCKELTHKRIRDLVARESFGERFVTKVLGRQLGLS